MLDLTMSSEENKRSCLTVNVSNVVPFVVPNVIISYFYKKLIMASVKIILKQNKLKNGVAPLYLRITKDRKTKFISIGSKLKVSDWNEETCKVKKSHPNSTRLNAFIANKVAEAENIAVELENKSKSVNSYKIKEKIIGKSSSSFFNYADVIIERLKSGNYGTYKRTKSVINKLKKYAKNKSVFFDDISVAFLKEYENYLSSELNNSINTIHANFRIIRKMLNDAVNEDLLPRDDNPFYKFKLKQEKTQREYLTEEELRKIEDVELTIGSILYHHRNMYVFAAYTGGLRISDVLLLKWSNFDGEKINIKIKKTSTPLSIKIPNTALKILKFYQTKKPDNKDYIFPVLNIKDGEVNKQLHKAISSASAYMNSNLKLICKKAKVNKIISFHSSRHTWATLALKKGMRIEYVSKLMGHSAIKETQVYAKIINAELDKAMEVFNK